MEHDQHSNWGAPTLRWRGWSLNPVNHHPQQDSPTGDNSSGFINLNLGMIPVGISVKIGDGISVNISIPYDYPYNNHHYPWPHHQKTRDGDAPMLPPSSHPSGHAVKRPVIAPQSATVSSSVPSVVASWRLASLAVRSPCSLDGRWAWDDLWRRIAKKATAWRVCRFNSFVAAIDVLFPLVDWLIKGLVLPFNNR